MSDEKQEPRNYTFPLTGLRIGSITVGQRGPDDSKGRRTWICHCACGNVMTLRSSQVTAHIGSDYWACSECGRAERASKGGKVTNERRTNMVDESQVELL